MSSPTSYLRRTLRSLVVKVQEVAFEVVPGNDAPEDRDAREVTLIFNSFLRDHGEEEVAQVLSLGGQITALADLVDERYCTHPVADVAQWARGYVWEVA